MDAILRDIVDTFETALGPFADPGVIALARELPVTATEPDAVRVLMQCHGRNGLRARPALLTVVGDRIVLADPDGPRRDWGLAGCRVLAGDVRLGGRRLTIVPADSRSVALVRAMPVDEVPRLLAIAQPATAPGSVSPHPPVARLGAEATLYSDRIAFAGAESRPLTGVRARALEISSASTALRSVSRLMQGARGRPRHVLVDGPDWSQVAAAPETSPDLADAFAEAVNRWSGA